MDKGLWIWPPDQKEQRRTLRKVADSPHLVAALKALAKSTDGLSNSELDELISDNSNWMTIWTVRQLSALGFIEYKVDLFGGPAKYVTTPLGRNAFAVISGQIPTAPGPSSPGQSAQTKPAVQKTG